ncbi:MAG: DNA polymerase III subunit delta' [Campylobacterota bacterium]|nr:DNA polymerase III subunit delta' [Campylobacterota bacterium]
MSTPERSHILITDEIEEAAEKIKERLHPERIVNFIPESLDFKIEDSRTVIKEAYISEERVKYLILGGKSFTPEAQNALLKVLEEPPRNIEFILIAPSKSVILPTIRSRLPMQKEKSVHEVKSIDLRLSALDLGSLFSFVKAHERLKKHEAKELIEAIFHQATVNEQLILTRSQLDAFDKSYRLIELNGRMQSILSMLLMSFLPETRRVG